MRSSSGFPTGAIEGVNLVASVSVAAALCAAFLFALGAHVQHLGLTSHNTRQATVVIVGTTAALHWLVAPFAISPTYWWTSATLFFLIAGLVRPTLSITFWVEGINRLGPTLNAGFSASSPIFAAAFAILLLNEPLSSQIALGTAGVIAGILVSSVRTTNIAQTWPLWAVSLPLAAAACRAAAHAITKLGFDVLSSPIFAGLVSTSLAFVLLLGRFIVSGEKFDSPPKQIGWFVVSGMTSAGGVFLLNLALQHGQVLTVSPIIASSPVFALLLAIFVFRREVLTWRTVVTISLIVLGVILVVTDRSVS
ncbi:MAG: EamA family transporter [Hyphomicrobiaceae bacterium]